MIIQAQNIPLNCGTISQNSSYLFKKPDIGGNRVKIIAQPQDRILVSTGSGYTTNYDATVFRSTNSSTITDFNVILYKQDDIPVTVYSTDNSILSNLNPNDYICSGVPTGSTSKRAVKIIASGTNTSDFNVAEANVNCNIGGQIDAFCEFTSGSLAKNCSDNVDNRLLNKNPAIAKNIYSTQDHSTSTYVRNTNCWAYDLDLTCMSPWNTTGANTRAGTLISPSHLVFATHYQIDIGAKVRFITSNNVVIERTLIDKIVCFGDASLGLLDSDVPNSISFAKLLPSNWSTYLPTIYRNKNGIYTIYRLPMLSLDQEEKALVTEFLYVDPTGSSVYTQQPTQNYLDPNNSYYNTYPNRILFHESIIGGDSGNPSFLIINNQLVLVMTWLGPDTGPFYSSFISILNTNMNLLWTRNNRSGSSYTATTINLSSFTPY